MKTKSANTKFSEMISNFHDVLKQMEEIYEDRQKTAYDDQSTGYSDPEIKHLTNLFKNFEESLVEGLQHTQIDSKYEWYTETKKLQSALNESLNDFITNRVINKSDISETISSPELLDFYGPEVADLGTEVIYDNQLTVGEEFEQAVFLKTSIHVSETKEWESIVRKWNSYTDTMSIPRSIEKFEKSRNIVQKEELKKISDVFDFLLVVKLLHEQLGKTLTEHSVGTEDYDHLIVDEQGHVFQADINIYNETDHPTTEKLEATLRQLLDSYEFSSLIESLNRRIVSLLSIPEESETLKNKINRMLSEQGPEEWIPLAGICFPHIHGKTIFFLKPHAEGIPGFYSDKTFGEWLAENCSTRLDETYRTYLEYLTHKLQQNL